MAEREWPTYYTTAYAMDTEHGRIGLVTCLTCGAAIVLGEDDGQSLHTKWHSALISEAEVRKALYAASPSEVR